ncbi:hypothetical protein L484_013369 [Morus notabilis]|uniref:Uncharacterized protein n=1 Tax=Morus notabilis TaxID=981085 RepID=W9QYY3_9ROSA|nr:hypothetical protein L484_013369 [Morus notabilis]
MRGEREREKWLTGSRAGQGEAPKRREVPPWEFGPSVFGHLVLPPKPRLSLFTVDSLNFVYAYGPSLFSNAL